MGTSNTKVGNSAQYANQPKTRTKIPHVWPESIDVDQKGNIYFTDAFEGKLYRIARNEDGILKSEEELLIEGLKRASGISISQNEDVLYMGLALKYSINRIILTSGKVTAIYSSSLKKAKNGLLGNLPDGLIRLTKGDLLVASFGSGKVFYLSQQGNYYSDPIEIVRGLGNPTDLTIGLSSKGYGMSLYVTIKNGGILPWKSISQGRVVEITDIEKKIEATENQIKPATK